MALGPIRFDGLSSGLNYTDIIKQLLSIESRPVTTLQNRIAKETDKKTALLQVSAGLLAFKGASDLLTKPSFFNRTTATSTNENVLLASGDQIAATGSFTFVVNRLAQSHQLVSNGFTDASTTAVASSAGKIRIEIGKGYLDNFTPLTQLNGGSGVDRGSIRVTDSSGDVSIINLEGALTVQDVLNAFNENTQINVRASVASDRVVLEDLAGGTPSNFKIENYGADTAASDLGIDGSGSSLGGKTYIFGTNINYVSDTTMLNTINDGLGVRGNADGINDMRITDTDGTAFSVDLRAEDTTILKVIDRINSAASVAGSSLQASINDGKTGLQLSDTAGAQGIVVSGANGSYAAVDLGFGIVSGASFAQVSAERSADGIQDTGGNRLVGSRLISSMNSRLRNLLNGGMGDSPASDIKGIRDGSIKITDRGGDNVTLNVSSRIQTTMASGISIGNTNALLTSVEGLAVGNQVRFAGSGNVRYRTITNIVGNAVYFDQALDVGFSAGQGAYAMNESLGDVVNVINNRAPASNVNVAASYNATGDGLYIYDSSGGNGSLSVSGVGGTFAASDLGIEMTVSKNSINGGDLNPQYVGENTLLSTLNSGEGVYAGKFRVLDTTGKTFDVDLSQSDDTTISQVVSEVNSAAQASASGVRARINNNGNGIYLEDTTPGAGTLRVEELNGGSTASDLNIEGSASAATPAVIDGSYEYNVDISAGAKLNDIVKAINDKRLSLFATVFNDGTSSTPYRLSILSKNSGTVGRLTVGTDISGLSFATTANAQDAVLLYGSNGSATDPLVITSSSNTIKNVVSGMTLDLRGASASPVTVTVDRDTQGVVDQVKRFVETYNDAIDNIKKFTAFNPDTFVTGTLFTEPVIRSVQRMIADVVTLPVNEISSGKLNNLAAVGVKMTDIGKLTFDESKFKDAMDTKYDEVLDLFTYQKRIKLDTALKDLNNGLGVSQSSGNDLKIVLRDSTSTISVDLGASDSIADVIDRINFDSENGGKVAASISPDGFSLRLTDNTSPATRTMEAPTNGTSFTESDFAGTYANDFFNGATITFLTPGSNYGQVRTVKDFDSATGLVTLDSALPVALSAGDSYKIEREMEVSALSGSEAASQLKIKQKLSLGESVLTGGLLNLKGDPGLAFRASEQLDFITKPTDGLISSRTNGIDDTIKGFNSDIEKLNVKIGKLEERLVKQFTNLELVLNESQGTISRLQSQLGGMVSMTQSQSKSK